MKSIWNDRWARIGALLIVGGGAIALALEASPFASAVIDMIGPKGVALLVLGGLVAAVILLLPGWWPLWRARRAGLPNPWVFALVTWGFTTASLQVAMVLVVVPLSVFQVFFAPQLEEYGVLSPHLSPYLTYVTEYWWGAFPLLQVFATIWAARALARPWSSINRAMSGGRDSTVIDAELPDR